MVRALSRSLYHRYTVRPSLVDPVVTCVCSLRVRRHRANLPPGGTDNAGEVVEMFRETAMDEQSHAI